jgi:myo-inositol-1(or 4)-monophosphatase
VAVGWRGKPAAAKAARQNGEATTIRQSVDLQKIKDVGFAAAARAGDVLGRFRGKRYDVQKKGAVDLVTDADLASEEAIVAVIRSAFPDHTIHAEERGLTAGRDAFTWIIDPLDGTTNFAHNLPEFSVSIAFACEGELLFGVVLNPVAKELFFGVAGAGAYLNGKPIRVSQVADIRDALLVTGFPYDTPAVIETLMRRFQRCLLAAQGLRRLGSAALDLCYMACGRFDGFWEQKLAPWDTAGGVVIAKEAGASITDFSNEAYSIYGDEILATNGRIHQELVTLLR